MSDTKALTRYDEAEVYLTDKRIRQALVEVVPRTLKPERIIRVLLGACRRKPELLKCTFFSLAYAMLEGASLGFTPGDVLGYAYLVPYGKEATLIVGYKGLIQLAYQSPAVVAVDGGVVCEEDTFSYELGTQPRVTHLKDLAHLPTEKNVIAAYAFARMAGAEWPILEVLMRPQIDDRRKRSRARSGPWYTDFGPMAQKSALRAALALAPKTPEIGVAMAREDAAERGLGLAETRDIMELDVSIPTEAEVLADPQPAEPDASEPRDDEIP